MTTMNPRLDQRNFRIRDDTNTPDGGTPNWITTENQATTEIIDVDTTFRVRFTIVNEGNANANNAYNLYYRVDTGGGFGSWAAVTTSTPIQADSAASTVGDDVTIATGNFLLTAEGGSTAATGQYDETGTLASQTLNSGNYTELEFGLSIDSAQVADGDTFEVRVYFNGTAFIDMTDPGTYDNVPSIEANEAAAGELSAQGVMLSYG